jgi:hypothetical protein
MPPFRPRRRRACKLSDKANARLVLSFETKQRAFSSRRTSRSSTISKTDFPAAIIEQISRRKQGAFRHAARCAGCACPAGSAQGAGRRAAVLRRAADSGVAAEGGESPTVEHPDSLIGRMVSHCRVSRRLGGGGMRSSTSSRRRHRVPQQAILHERSLYCLGSVSTLIHDDLDLCRVQARRSEQFVRDRTNINPVLRYESLSLRPKLLLATRPSLRSKILRRQFVIYLAAVITCHGIVPTLCRSASVARQNLSLHVLARKAIAAATTSGTKIPRSWDDGGVAVRGAGGAIQNYGMRRFMNSRRV